MFGYCYNLVKKYLKMTEQNIAFIAPVKKVAGLQIQNNCTLFCNW